MLEIAAAVAILIPVVAVVVIVVIVVAVASILILIAVVAAVVVLVAAVVVISAAAICWRHGLLLGNRCPKPAGERVGYQSCSKESYTRELLERTDSKVMIYTRLPFQECDKAHPIFRLVTDLDI